MIIHSIVSPDDIFYSHNPQQTKAQLAPIKYGFVELDEKRMVKRVISTNPRDYLDKNYQLDRYMP